MLTLTPWAAFGIRAGAPGAGAAEPITPSGYVCLSLSLSIYIYIYISVQVSTYVYHITWFDITLHYPFRYVIGLRQVMKHTIHGSKQS